MPGLSIFESALRGLAGAFDAVKVPYMVIGGLANAIWGNPRATIDIDITIWVVENQTRKLLTILEKEYTPLVDNPIEFLSETRVLPVRSKDNLKVDIIFGALPFEKNALDRALTIKVGDTPIKFCTAEDLILHKIISERPKDLEDVRGILHFQKKNLDYTYLEPRIEELSNLLERPDLSRQWDSWKIEEGMS